MGHGACLTSEHGLSVQTCDSARRGHRYGRIFCRMWNRFRFGHCERVSRRDRWQRPRSRRQWRQPLRRWARGSERGRQLLGWQLEQYLERVPHGRRLPAE